MKFIELKLEYFEFLTSVRSSAQFFRVRFDLCKRVTTTYLASQKPKITGHVFAHIHFGSECLIFARVQSRRSSSAPLIGFQANSPIHLHQFKYHRNFWDLPKNRKM